MSKIDYEDKKVKTPMARLAYLSLFEPTIIKGKKSTGKNEPKYRATLIFDSEKDLTPLKAAAEAAATELWGERKNWPHKMIRSKKSGKLIRKSLIKWPFKDGDVECPDKPEFAGKMFVRADKSTAKGGPKVCDIRKDENGKFVVLKKEDNAIKSGDYGRAQLLACAFEVDGAYSVKFVLMMVQKLKSGEALGGGQSVDEAFDDDEYQHLEQEAYDDAMSDGEAYDDGSYEDDESYY